MKRVFIIAAAWIAALPMAHASSILYNFVGTGETDTPSGVAAITLTGYKSGTVQTGTNCTTGNGPYCITGATTSGVSLTYNSNGLGVNYTGDPDPNEIGFLNPTNNFVVIDFSSPIAKGYTSATIKLDNVTDGYIVYEGAKGASGLNKLIVGAASASGGPPVVSKAVTVPLALTAANPFLVFMATGQCVLNIQQISVSTPEPGTFLMAGMALIGLGMALRKVRKG